MGARYWLLGLIAAACFACGNNGGGSNGDGGLDPNDEDGGVGETIDAPPFGGTCTPVAGAPQCSDCIDNDNDGKIDGFDPECTGPADNDESSFKTGIPGDNIDATMQDCFFDGNSGAGDDGCNQHTCCLLQAKGTISGSETQLEADKRECKRLAPKADEKKYDPAKCYQPFGNTPVSPKCKMNCGPLTPPGCDCFGCCTICNENGCRDVLINPQVSPDCQSENITDPGPDGMDNTGDEPCRRCVKSDCGSEECGGDTCILCPGQETLPPGCTGAACPSGIQACGSDGSCPAGTWCSTGCCIGNFL
jgi:hypothetical protein